MNAPFDPGETHDGAEHEDPFGENSMTWGTADPAFDEAFRERLGPLPTMPTPPYAFERVLLAGRRRRARKVWGASAAAALVVMAGTAGTTVALHGSSPGVAAPASGASQQSTTLLSSPTPSLSVTPLPSMTATRATKPSASTAAPATSTGSSATVAQCHSDDLQLTVQVQPGSAGSADAVLIVLRNNSAHACTTYGYPGLQTETVNEQLQTTTVKRDSSNGSPKHLTVGPGQYVSTIATFTTVASDVTPAPSAGCGAPSYYLAVIPPNEQNQIAATIQGGPVTVCDNGVLDTGPLVMGKTGVQ